MAAMNDPRTADGITEAPGAGRHGPKLRSRKEGAAITLSDLDKRLLNLMQGQFPIAPRPYQHVAAEAGVAEEEAMAAVTRLLEERIIRQVTPIFDTRALGYSSMLVAAKVDPANPWRAATVINSHPGVSHNYLRNHEFNIWFTIATEPGSKLGLQGTLDVLAREAGAESVRQLPTLKLFKIRMDLEMEGGTDALSKVAEAAEPAETERQPYDEFDQAVIRALQGDMPVIAEPYAPAAAQLGIGQDELLEHLRGMQELGMRMASFRGISHCYQRPTYADWPYSVFTMAHGRSKEECDAILDSIAADTGVTERATLYSSTEFKKIRLLYFTEAHADWEREHAGV
jgi:siroheme decarboxylase